MNEFNLKTLFLLFVSSSVWALPSAENVISGAAQFDQNGSNLNVQQNTDFLHVQYESFDIAGHESVQFIQPNTQSIVINQVLNSDPTQIAGQLTANGQMFLLAPGGLVIHEGATIEATSFFASSLEVESVSDQGIQLNGVTSAVGIHNAGHIAIDGGGHLQLLSHSIVNEGMIENNLGDVTLNVASKALVKFSDDLFAVEIEASALDGVIENTGTVSSVAGNVELSAHVRNQVHELVIDNQGDIQATSVWEEGGDIYIGSNEGDIENHGLIESINHENMDSTSHIQINSDRIANFGRIKNNGNGIANAGSIELNAESTVVLLNGSEILANADVQGDGGNIKVFSPKNAIFRNGANIEAEAGFELGDGGFVDVSGWEYVGIFGNVSTFSHNGLNGKFLIDPYNITISAAADASVGFASNVYTPSNTGAIINVGTLQTNLKNGDVTIVTTGAGGESGDITVDDAINLDGTNGKTLTLDATGSIIIKADIMDNDGNTVDSTGLSFNANNGSISLDGIVILSGGGNVNLNANAGSINMVSGSSIYSSGGQINLLANSGNINLGYLDSTGGNMSLLASLNIIDNNTTLRNIDAGGGVVRFDANLNIGGTSFSDSIEVTDSLIDLTANASGMNVYLTNNHASTSLTLQSIDFDSGNGLNFNVETTVGGDIIIDGTIDDSITGTADSATFNLQNTGAGQITFTDSSVTNTRGGNMTINSVRDVSVAHISTETGTIDITADNIIDMGTTGSDLNAGGGILNITASGNVGSTAFSSAIEIANSVINYTASGTNQNVYIHNDEATDLIFNTVIYDGTGNFNFNVLSRGTSGLIVQGDIYDIDNTADTATISLQTSQASGDITINDGATIRSGDSGSITLDSANDIYLTGVFGGAGGTIITAANDITENGDVTVDVNSTGAVTLSAGRHIADVGSLLVAATTLSLNLGSDNHNIGTLGNIILGNIEVDGANGAQLSIVGNADIDITGSITDATGSDDLIDLTLGTSAGGFLIFPDAGYTVPGSLTFWGGTAGIKDSTDERISLTANSVTSSGNNFLSNIGPVIFDLTVDDIDFRDDTGIVSFEINNSKNLSIIDLDGDGEYLLGKEFKINVSGDLTIPNVGLRDVDDQLWLIANDIDDPDGDNIISVIDSSDPDSAFNLIVELKGANDVHVNTDISHFDGTVAAGGTLTITNFFNITDLNLASDLNSDGAFINGAGNIILSAQDTLTLPNAGISTTGNLFLTANDIMDSDENITITANQLFIEYLNPTAPLYTLDLTVSALDASMAGQNASLHVQNSQALSIQDLNNDGEYLLGKEFKINVNGDLTIPNLGLSDVDEQIWIIANDIDDPDADNEISVVDSSDPDSTFNLIVELKGANDVHINTDISHFDGTVAAGGTLTINNNVTISDLNLASDLNSDGAFINGAGNIILGTQGTLTLPDAGISTAGNVFLTANDIMDSDEQINITANQLFIEYLNPTASLYFLDLTVLALDASMAGQDASLRVSSNQGISIQDLNDDGNSLQVSDGYFWLEAAGDISISDTVSVIDSTADGMERGWMYLGYQGNASFGVNGALDMTIDGSIDTGTPPLVTGLEGNQLLVRQTGAASAANTLSFVDSNIKIIGGDAAFDITNATGDIINTGTVTMSTNSTISVSNTSVENVFTNLVYPELSMLGTLNVVPQRNIAFTGFNTQAIEEVVELPDEIVEKIDQIVSDVIKETVGDNAQSVTNDIQEETVGAVESSPNVNIALNQMFSGCKQSNSDETRCQMKDEISRFLGRFLMGGSMPKTN